MPIAAQLNEISRHYEIPPRYQLEAPQRPPFAYGCAVQQLNCEGISIFAISEIWSSLLA